MSSPEDIWSTRLQRELLALTSTAEAKDGKHSHIGALPPFLTIQGHNLDIENGRCTIAFAVEVDYEVEVEAEAKSEAKETTDEENVKKEEEEEEGQTNDGGNDDNAKEEEEDENKEQKDTNETPPTTTTTTTTTTKITQEQVIITLDASINLRPGTQTRDASISYPFFKPRSFLTAGAEFLPRLEELEQMNIRNGDAVQIDCDWTPSLHLNDAALNVALKVRESVKRGEGCLKKDSQGVMGVFGRNANVSGGNDGGGGAYDFNADENSPEKIVGRKVGSFFSSLKNKANAMAEEMDNAMDSWEERRTLRKERKQERRPVSAANTNAIAPAKIVTIQNIESGDEIDLSQDPWNKAVGMFPCNAIRRPEFVVSAMKVTEKAEPKVAGAGIAGAGSIFKSFSRQAKSLVEESFLMLTEELIVEIKCNKFSVANANVTFVIPVSHLSKLKFRREESISLFFKQAPDDPIIYMCPSSADAVKQIQIILKRHGVKGTHTNATMQRYVQIAMQIIADIDDREKALQENPTPSQVTEIMDLYRQAAEKFETAGDKRHMEVMAHMREFLAKPHIASVLDGTAKPQPEPTPAPEPSVTQATATEPEPAVIPATTPQEAAKTVPEGEVLEAAPLEDEEEEEDDDEQPSKVDDETEDFEKAMKEAEDMLNNAHDGLKNLGSGGDMLDDIDDDDDDDILGPMKPVATSSTEPKQGGDDMLSEFEDMLEDSIKELDDLMSS